MEVPDVMGDSDRQEAAPRHQSRGCWCVQSITQLAEGVRSEEPVLERRGTNHKNTSVVARLPRIWRFHKGLRTLLRSASTNATQTDVKYGRYPPHCRFNVDQVPLAFDMGSGMTWDDTGSKRCWIKKHLQGLDKRFCTLQVCICADTQQPVKLTIIFRSASKGDRIGAKEKKQYDSRVHVLWQKKAWADRETCVEWAKEVFRRGTSRADEKLLFLDNLDGQICDDFVTYLRDKCNTKTWYGPSGCTDHWQPVDHHIGKLLKDFIYNEYETMMEEEGDKWENGKISAGEKRILITRWPGAAWEKLRTKYGSTLKKAFTSTGCGLTLDIVDDELVHPESFPNEYHKLLAMEQLPAEHLEAYNAALAVESAAEQRQREQEQADVDGADDPAAVAAMVEEAANESDQEGDAEERDIEAVDESESDSGGEDPEREYNWQRITGVRKLGSGRKWQVEWDPKDCDEDDEPRSWVTLSAEEEEEAGEHINLEKLCGQSIFVKWATSASNAARVIEGRVCGAPSEDPEKFKVKYNEDNTVETVDLIRPTARRPYWSLFAD